MRYFFLSLLVVFLQLLIACSENSATTNAGVGEVAQQESFQWKLVTTWPKNFPGLGLAPVKFAEHVETMSNGRLKIKVFAAGELVPALEVFGTVSSGTAEMGHGAAYYWKGKVPAAQFFTAVPFGLNAQEMNSWLYFGDGMALWREVYEPFNLIPMAGGNTGVQMAGWFNKEVNSLDDLRGLKMRIPGLGGEVFSRAGGTAVNMPGGEIYTSLQTGVIDAAEWVGPYNDLAFGFQNIAKYYYYPGWQEPGPSLEFIVNKSAFEALPEDLQAIVEVAARAVNQNMLDEYTARNNAALKALINEHNVQVRRLPDDVLDALRSISDEVIGEMIAQNPQMQRIYQSLSAFRDDVSDYHQISEQAFYDIRE